MKLKHNLFLLFFLFFAGIISGQTSTIFRQKSELQKSRTNHEKLNNALALCEQGYSLHPDTLMKYASYALQLAKILNNEHRETEARYYQSFGLTNKGLIDSSLSLANQCLAIVPQKIKDPVLHANLLNQKGRCFMRKGRFNEAIEMGLQVITISEKSKDTLLQMKGKTLIGWAYLEMGQSEEALSWHLKALNTTKNQTLRDKYGILYANLALNYNNLEKVDSAFYFIEKAIKASRVHENLFALSNSLAIQAQLYVRAGRVEKAEAPLKEVVEIRKLIGDPFYIVSDMAQLALYYAHNGQPQKGIEISLEGIEMAREFNIKTKFIFLYSTLGENYLKAGDNKNYANTLEKIIALKDSMYNQNSSEELAEMQAKYNIQKKENLIIKQQLDLTRQKYYLWGTLSLIVLILIISILLFKNYKRKIKEKQSIRQSEIQRINLEAVINAEEKERKRIATDLHDNMGAYASAILAGVDELILENKSENTGLLGSMKSNASTIMMDLRDTIWVLYKSELKISDISDRYKNFVQKISPSYPEINLEITENIQKEISFSPQGALNMLRIMQEAFHNAIKHSRCRQINITISSENGVYIMIRDDGIGLPENFIKGNGVANMQMRAKANGWKCEISNTTTGGTTVELFA